MPKNTNMFLDQIFGASLTNNGKLFNSLGAATLHFSLALETSRSMQSADLRDLDGTCVCIRSER